MKEQIEALIREWPNDRGDPPDTDYQRGYMAACEEHGRELRAVLAADAGGWRSMDSLIVYPDGTDQPGVEIPVANGFVSRCVGAIAEYNIPDAQHAARVLNSAAWQPITEWEQGRPHRAMLFRPGGPLGTYRIAYSAEEPLPRPMGKTFGENWASMGWTHFRPLPEPPPQEPPR